MNAARGGQIVAAGLAGWSSSTGNLIPYRRGRVGDAYA